MWYRAETVALWLLRSSVGRFPQSAAFWGGVGGGLTAVGGTMVGQALVDGCSEPVASPDGLNAMMVLSPYLV